MTFDEATAAAAPQNLVSATMLKDGTWDYFVVRPSADPAEIAQRAFLIREGRPMTAHERYCFDVAQARKTVDV